MVVLSAAIVNKQGKPLVARQFLEMTRIRIEGLLAAFPKLIGGNSQSKQHTYVETESVRYVYQPMETLFLLLITTKSSNILEDLETLRLLSKVVQEHCQSSMDEEGIFKNAFQLVFSFDEVISLGYRESVTLPQIKTYIEMESHEEKIFNMIKATKLKEAKEQLKKKEQEIDKRRMELERDGGGIGSNRGFNSTGGYGPGMGYNGPSSLSSSSPSMGMGGMNSSGMGSMSAPSQPRVEKETAPTVRAPGKGMQLGSKVKKSESLMQALAQEAEVAAPAAGGAAAAGAAAAPAYNPLQEAVLVALEEKVSVKLSKDGGLENMEVKGDLFVTCRDESKSRIAIRVVQGPNKGYQYKLHPLMNKQAWTDNFVLSLKEAQRPYPLNTPTPVLKWRFPTKDESLVPLSVNCWPSATAGGVTVNMEYELKDDNVELHNVSILVPIISNQPPQVGQVDGAVRLRGKECLLEWHIDTINSNNSTGSLEFSAVVDPSSLFPVNLSFSAQRTLCQLMPAEVVAVDDHSPVSFIVTQNLTTEEYQVV
eukprot:GILI01005802.1.p1 GENE.GILI01005802.1~~GILI01005802.1.p1  ORF type:complete len:536 (-),score=184.62 GILI01005802.1:109-1716(-)